MKKGFNLSFKQLVIILTIIFFVISSESVNFLYITKNTEYMNNFLKTTDILITKDTYILANMITYFFVVINYVILALFTYIGRNKIKVGVVYKAVYFFIILFTLIYEIFLNKAIYINYVAIILQIVLMIYVINLKEKRS
ncbi:hypothetical protein [Oceanivirga miroungae]|uniref:Uncharacterized protein n=1 Tax=Oceanivirga miroungae TaxID=1130046 RepID=A0A6I8MDD5_9FUSO|nr:hypothetical protein [Oceanivirga miroungae]VWL85173.1 hypothetical protein OMES3154_00457 [Oceanivirga miroungae]